MARSHADVVRQVRRGRVGILPSRLSLNVTLLVVHFGDGAGWLLSQDFCLTRYDDGVIDKFGVRRRLISFPFCLLIDGDIQDGVHCHYARCSNVSRKMLHRNYFVRILDKLRVGTNGV